MLSYVGMSQNISNICKSDITDFEEKTISLQLKQIDKRASQIFYSHEVGDVFNKQIGWFRCDDLMLFLKRIIVNDEKIERIMLLDSVLTIYYHPEFYQFQMMAAVYHQYNDLYNTLFSYNEIEAISIILTDGTNITFLPTISSDYWFTIEDAIMKKEWFIKNIDYVSLMGMKIAEDSDNLTKKGEFRASMLDRLINEYKMLVNSTSQTQ